MQVLSYLVPSSIIQFGSSFHTDQDICFPNLHFRNPITQGKHKPVPALFGVPVEDDALRIEGAKLKVGVDAAGEARHIQYALSPVGECCYTCTAVEFPLHFYNSGSDSSAATDHRFTY